VSPKETTDPRIYMAAERTFLAWIRTSIALIVFGFVIEKFEFFLEQLEKVFNMSLNGDHKALASVGVFIIFIGLFTLILGALNFYRTINQVDAGYYRGCSKNPLLGPSLQPLKGLTYSSPYPTPLPPIRASEEKGLVAKPFQG